MAIHYAKIAAYLLVCNFIIISANGATAQEQSNPFALCAAIQDDQQRLSCFDQAARTGNSSLPEIDTAIPDVLVSPTNESRIAEFGRPPVRQAPTQTNDDEIHVTIVSWKKYSYNKWVFTTSDGQVWRQMDDRRIHLRGSQVGATIRKVMMGGFRLKLDGQSWGTRVKRVR